MRTRRSRTRSPTRAVAVGSRRRRLQPVSAQAKLWVGAWSTAARSKPHRWLAAIGICQQPAAGDGFRRPFGARVAQRVTQDLDIQPQLIAEAARFDDPCRLAGL